MLHISVLMLMINVHSIFTIHFAYEGGEEKMSREREISFKGACGTSMCACVCVSKI